MSQFLVVLDQKVVPAPPSPLSLPLLVARCCCGCHARAIADQPNIPVLVWQTYPARVRFRVLATSRVTPIAKSCSIDRAVCLWWATLSGALGNEFRK